MAGSAGRIADIVDRIAGEGAETGAGQIGAADVADEGPGGAYMGQEGQNAGGQIGGVKEIADEEQVGLRGWAGQQIAAQRDADLVQGGIQGDGLACGGVDLRRGDHGGAKVGGGDAAKATACAEIEDTLAFNQVRMRDKMRDQGAAAGPWIGPIGRGFGQIGQAAMRGSGVIAQGQRAGQDRDRQGRGDARAGFAGAPNG